MNKYDEFYRARDIIVDILRKDMIGPVTEDEILTEEPDRFYSMGKLYPDKNQEENDMLEEDENLLEDQSESCDYSISLANQFKPSAMGITFAIKRNILDLCCDVEYAIYSFDDKEGANKWKRKAFSHSEKIDLSLINSKYEKDLTMGVQLYLYIQKEYPTGEKVITVGLINKNKSRKFKSESEKNKNLVIIHQPSIRIFGVDEKDIFTSVDKRVKLSKDLEVIEFDMLYSDSKCYAQGHGCSADWDVQHQEPRWISTNFMPEYRLRQLKAKKFEFDKMFSMKYYSEASKSDIICSLRNFVELYSKWIENLKESIDDEYRVIAEININKCEDTKQKLLRAITLLEQDSDGINFKAFRYANEAMMMQRMQYIRNHGGCPDEKAIQWYPFQLAFILLEMVSFLDEKGEERKKVDLLWFPTGGGKTEAYLGIAAFVIFRRRLLNSQADGVTIFMRYTLRLLTIQQFQRASMLIMACEILRKKYKLGGSEISIGLWVGGGMTPNKLVEAEKSLKNRDSRYTGKIADVYHIKKCPWCGEDIFPSNYEINHEQSKMTIKCQNKNCSFFGSEGGIPLHLVDEDMYAHVPTFIVATVDKFAQLPLNSEPAKFFGISNNKKPPELIIQDELHLISGPLGTMTGLYELVVDKFCEHNKIPVKIIASTATIRNADKQIRALYGREFTQFPPQGLRIKDCFFAEEASPGEKPERLYLGVMGTGSSSTNTFLRLNAAMLFATRYLRSEGFSDEVIDNFWTITDYFNTLRELGSSLTNVRDFVQSRYKYLYSTKFKDVYNGENMDISSDLVAELTSRKKNSEIMQYITSDLLKEYKNDTHLGVYDFILSSNMISVGIDIGRLGVMIVNNQPKTNAEYIQATSRVGRKNPGVVVTAYGQGRSRDRSHYEQFLKYHSALYRYVEASSITPFSDRARDRGLHALYIALCRYLIPNMLPNEAARLYDKNDKRFEEIDQIILNHVEKVDPEELDNVKAELKEIKNLWDEKTYSDSLYYKSYKENSLLKNEIEDDRFRTMNSLRSVDKKSEVYILNK